MALRHYTINFAAKFDTIAITLTMLEWSKGYSQAIDQCTETQVELFLPSPTYQRSLRGPDCNILASLAEN